MRVSLRATVRQLRSAILSPLSQPAATSCQILLIKRLPSERLDYCLAVDIHFFGSAVRFFQHAERQVNMSLVGMLMSQDFLVGIVRTDVGLMKRGPGCSTDLTSFFGCCGRGSDELKAAVT